MAESTRVHFVSGFKAHSHLVVGCGGFVMLVAELSVTGLPSQRSEVG